MFKFFARSLMTIVFLSVFGSLFLIWAMLDDLPVVSATRVIDARDAVQARELVKDLKRGISGDQELFQMAVNEQEFNSLMAILHRALPRLNGEVRVWPDGVLATVSVRLPENPLGAYLNCTVNVRPSASGLDIEGVSLGNVPVPGRIVLWSLRQGLSLLLGKEEGDLVDLVESVAIEGTTVRVTMRGVADLDRRLASMKQHVQEVRQTVAPIARPEDIRAYYAALQDIDGIFSGSSGPLSIAQFVRPVFQMAMERSDDPVRENQAAILALAIQFGHARMNTLIGDPLPAHVLKRRLQSGPVILGGRQDLRQHFMLSAGLKVVSDQGVSLAVGEIKELLDSSTTGGSGFSFVDLAADRAGVRFAAAASDAQSARRMQEILSSVADEQLFFPDIEGLPEGIGSQSFERVFGNMESAEYGRLVGAIDSCIERLPAFRGPILGEIAGGGAGDCRLAERVPTAMLQRMQGSSAGNTRAR